MLKLFRYFVLLFLNKLYDSVYINVYIDCSMMIKHCCLYRSIYKYIIDNDFQIIKYCKIFVAICS